MVEDKIAALMAALSKRGWMMATAESCTGGMIASAMTDRAGSSLILDCGFVTYSNESKEKLINVPHDILVNHGAVSRECALAMVQGCLAASPKANLAIAVTGIAGPGGGSAEKPVGLVYIGWGLRGDLPLAAEYRFSGDRAAIRDQTVNAALQNLLDFINHK